MGIIKGNRTILLAALLLCINASAQKRVSADVEVKQVYQGKVTTTTKSVYCANDGRLVVVFHTPEEYYEITNAKGEARIYVPSLKEVYVDNSGDINSKDELINIFLSGNSEDLGLRGYGYMLTSTVREDGVVKRTFTTAVQGRPPKIEIVFENFLPIYAAYYDNAGKVLTKTYFSNYSTGQRFVLPTRTTQISYGAAGDSTVVRTIYSNIRLDGTDKEFDFQVPKSAKSVTLKDLQKKTGIRK